jgi:hypothetical protein
MDLHITLFSFCSEMAGEGQHPRIATRELTIGSR